MLPQSETLNGPGKSVFLLIRNFIGPEISIQLAIVPLKQSFSAEKEVYKTRKIIKGYTLFKSGRTNSGFNRPI